MPFQPQHLWLFRRLFQSWDLTLSWPCVWFVGKGFKLGFILITVHQWKLGSLGHFYAFLGKLQKRLHKSCQILCYSCWCLSCIPCCLMRDRDISHMCPYCNRLLGTYQIGWKTYTKNVRYITKSFLTKKIEIKPVKIFYLFVFNAATWGILLKKCFQSIQRIQECYHQEIILSNLQALQ